MYARIRQKISITQATTVVENGSNVSALSVLIKDIAKIITGSVNTLANLNQSIWDIPNSEMFRSSIPTWTEYQSTFLSTANQILPSQSENTNIVYLRSISSNLTFKYAGLGYASNSLTPSENYSWTFMYPWNVTNFEGDPILSFRNNSPLPSSSALSKNAFRTDVLMEYTIFSSPKAIFISASSFQNSAFPYKICCMLEYPSTLTSNVFKLPNQVYWELSSAYTSGGSSGNSTNYITNGYAVNGGFNPIDGSESYISSPAVNDANFAYVYTPYFGNLGNTSLWSSSTASSELSTLKANIFSGMSNTISLTGESISVPILQLLHFPPWDSCYDLSSLTGIYATKSSLGATGDIVSVNGKTYAYINSKPVGILVPRE